MRSSLREVAGIFGVVLVFVALATVASILATAGLGLIAFVPLAGFVVFPLTAAGWLLRGFVFQYLALTALGAYLTQYRHYLRGAPPIAAVPGTTSGMINYDAFLSRSAQAMKESAIRKMGTLLAQGRDIVSFAPGYPAPEMFPWAEFQDITAALLSGKDGAVLQYGATRGYRPLARGIAAIMAARGAPTSLERLLVTTGSQQGLDLVARVLLDPGRRDPRRASDLHRRDRRVPERPGARWSACVRRRDGLSLEHLDETWQRLRARRPACPRLYVVPELPEPDRPADWPRKAQRAARMGRAPGRADRRGRPLPRSLLRGLGVRSRCAAHARRRRDGRVIYLSSFSKTLAPGYRVAWIDAPAPIAAKLELAKQAADLCTGGLDQRVVYEACRRGCSIVSCRCCARTTSRSATSWSAALREAFGSDLQLAGAARRVLPVGDAAAWHRRGRDDPAGHRARRHLRRRRGVLRRTGQAAVLSGCRSRRRRTIESAKACAGWPPTVQGELAASVSRSRTPA